MNVHCPECDAPIQLERELIETGVPKIRCNQCSGRFRVAPGGTTIVLSGNPSAGRLPVGQQLGSASRASAADTSNAAQSPADVAAPNLTGHIGYPASRPANAAGPSLDAPALDIGRHFHGKYRIDAVIGRGGSATVYRAHDIDAEIDRALKVVGAVGGGADGIRRAWAEEYKARLKVADGTHLLTLESPQVEEIEGTTYVALPQELGQSTLREWLQDKKNTIAEHREEALRLFAQVCRGVEALHDRNIAHLDLKPENVLLIDDGDEWTAKVGDFGLARAAGGLQRREGVGTPQYMAPEQVRAAREKDIGPWSDIYALGCMLYELLDGDRPFSGTAEELKDKHLNMAPTELEGVPPHLERLAMACLAKGRKERPESVPMVRQGVELDPAEEAALAKARKTGTTGGWQSFLNQWGGGKHDDEVREALRKLELEREEKERQERARKKREREERKERERKEQKRKEKEREEAERRARQQAEEARRREQRRVLEPVDIHGWDADRVQERQRKQAEALGMPVIFRDQLANESYGPEMVLIPSGVYLMGSSTDEFGSFDCERPKHRVTISNPFAIGRYALTFAEWCRSVEEGGYIPGGFGSRCDTRSATSVSWEDSQAYLRWLALQTNGDYRLPSESEWEYACRAGSTTRSYTSDIIFNRGTGRVTGNLESINNPNTFGLHNMLGSVAEWVQDCWNETYEGAPDEGTAWQHGDFAVLRGGAYEFRGVNCVGSARRNWLPRDFRGNGTGFRPAKSL